jgi:uncharacterized protein (TIGR02147 family)
VAELPADRRHASGVTLGISLKTYQRICAELDSLRAKALAMAEQDKKADNVYQLSLNLFPVSDVQGTLRGRSAKRGGRAAGTSTRKGR